MCFPGSKAKLRPVSAFYAELKSILTRSNVHNLSQGTIPTPNITEITSNEKSLEYFLRIWSQLTSHHRCIGHYLVRHVHCALRDMNFFDFWNAGTRAVAGGRWLVALLRPPFPRSHSI